MDNAVTSFIGTRYGINKNAEQSGEQVSGENVMRRSLQAAFISYLNERTDARAAELSAQQSKPVVFSEIEPQTASDEELAEEGLWMLSVAMLETRFTPQPSVEYSQPHRSVRRMLVRRMGGSRLRVRRRMKPYSLPVGLMAACAS